MFSRGLRLREKPSAEPVGRGRGKTRLLQAGVSGTVQWLPCTALAILHLGPQGQPQWDKGPLLVICQVF